MTDPSSPQRKPPFVVTDKMRRQIAGAVAEVDLGQAAIFRKMTPAQRVATAAAMNNSAQRVVAYRLRQREPHLKEEEALYIVRTGIVEYEQRKKRWLPLKTPS